MNSNSPPVRTLEARLQQMCQHYRTSSQALGKVLLRVQTNPELAERELEGFVYRLKEIDQQLLHWTDADLQELRSSNAPDIAALRDEAVALLQPLKAGLDTLSEVLTEYRHAQWQRIQKMKRELDGQTLYLKNSQQ